MLARLRNWILGEPEPETEEEETPAPEPRAKRSIFSTDVANIMRKTQDDENRIKLDGPATFATATIPGGESFTFDEAAKAYGMDSTTLKSAFTGAASAMPQDLFQWYNSQSFIGYQACAILSQNWLINKTLVIPAKDAVRNGYEITKNDGEKLEPEIINAFKQLAKKYKINKNLIEFETNKRRFGFRIALFVVESSDPEYYRKPFNIDSVTPGSYKGITQIDPSWIAPVLDQQASANPAAIDFYEPTWWQINGKLYHKSHIVIARYADLPDILKPTYQYGGLPLPQIIAERVYASERTANEAPMLAETKRLNVVHVDLASIEADSNAFEERLEQFIGFRNNYGVYVAGIDDVVNQIDTSLADLDDLIMTQYQLVAAVAEMPATKLLSTSPKGFNATGEHEQQNYYELLENIQTDLTMILDRHHQLVIRADIVPKYQVDPFAIDTIWNPVNTPNAKEQSEINLNKSQTDANLQLAGSIDGFEIRDRLINDPKSGYNGLEAFDPDDPEDLGAIEELEQEALNTQVQAGAQDNALGYVSVVPDRWEARHIALMLRYEGIEGYVAPELMHITLAHDVTGITNYSPDNSVYDVDMTGEIGLLGEGGSEALVLFIKSPALKGRHEDLKAMGAEYKYDQYTPHMTLKYRPEIGDLDKAVTAFSKEALGTRQFGGERLQVVK